MNRFFLILLPINLPELVEPLLNLLRFVPAVAVNRPSRLVEGLDKEAYWGDLGKFLVKMGSLLRGRRGPFFYTQFFKKFNSQKTCGLFIVILVTLYSALNCEQYIKKLTTQP